MEGLPAASFKKSMQDLSAIAFLATLIALLALTIGLVDPAASEFSLARGRTKKKPPASQDAAKFPA